MNLSSYQSYSSIWAIWQAIRNLLPAFYVNTLRQALIDQELAELPFGMLVHAYDVHSAPLTAESIQVCVPYYHTAPFDEHILKITKAGLFHTPDNKHYSLTEDAYCRVDTAYRAIYTALGELDVLEGADLDWLVTIIQGMLDRSLAGNYPTPAATMEYKPERTCDIQPLAKLSASMDVLFNFRCDAHQAAWRGLDISPPALEIWTLHWRNEAETVQDVIDVLAAEFPRGYTRIEYQAFTDELVQRGWLVSADSVHYRLTQAGQTQRDAVEDETNRLFYAAWEVLSKVELRRLHDLSQQLLSELQILAEREQVGQ